MDKKWSVGIKVFGYFFILLAFLPYLIPLISSIRSGDLMGMPSSIHWAFANHLWSNLLILLIPITLGLGMLMRIEPIRRFTIVMLVLFVFSGIGMLFIPGYSLGAKIVIVFVASLFYLSLLFLSHPKVKEQFKSLGH